MNYRLTLTLSLLTLMPAVFASAPAETKAEHESNSEISQPSFYCFIRYGHAFLGGSRVPDNEREQCQNELLGKLDSLLCKHIDGMTKATYLEIIEQAAHYKKNSELAFTQFMERDRIERTIYPNSRAKVDALEKACLPAKQTWKKHAEPLIALYKKLYAKSTNEHFSFKTLEEEMCWHDDAKKKAENNN